MSTVSKRRTPIEISLDAIEARLENTLSLSRILLADKLIRDGHASDWLSAMRLTKDLDAVAKFYPDVD